MTIGSWVHEAYGNVTHSISGALNRGKTVLVGAVNDIKKTGQTVKGAVTTVYSDVKSGISGAGSIVSNAINTTGSVALNAENKLSTIFTGPIVYAAGAVAVIYLINRQ
jgi:phage-related protein